MMGPRTWLTLLFVTGILITSCGESGKELVESRWDSGEPTEGEIDATKRFERGAEIYLEYCAACHREDGTGIGKIYPPLAGSDFLEDKEATIASVVNGLQGEISVNGVRYNAMMPPLPPAYEDEDAAMVINYIVARFSESAWETSPAEVSDVRE